MLSGDTIAAISSAVGPAARMIVRASGPGAVEMAGEICSAVPIPSRTTRIICDLGEYQFPCDLLFFPAGRSATGEDTIEFHLPGNPLLARKLLDALVGRGARFAEAGEFTARGYFNGRMDLSQAEGVAATIAAQNDRQLAAARQLLSGELARKLGPILDGLAETLALVEVGIDFTEEDVKFLSDEQVRGRIAQSDAALAALLAGSRRFESISGQVTVALFGRPNAGKSTLLNALAGTERAVVSPIAGTTRDALSAEVRLPSGIVRVIDVAGLEAADDPTDPSAAADIARQMRQTALRTLEAADVVVLLHDCTAIEPPPTLPRTPNLTVLTKIDLLPEGSRLAPSLADAGPTDVRPISVRTHQNLDEFRQKLDRLAFGKIDSTATLVLSARHVDAIDSARRALADAAMSIVSGHEMLALDLRDALDHLGLILGTVSPDDLLGKIFSAFCIGK